jgi:hypothetical protein
MIRVNDPSSVGAGITPAAWGSGIEHKNCVPASGLRLCSRDDCTTTENDLEIVPVNW